MILLPLGIKRGIILIRWVHIISRMMIVCNDLGMSHLGVGVVIFVSGARDVERW